MHGRERFRQVVDIILSQSACDQTEVLITSGCSGVTRFASSAIHQNVVETDASVRIRVVQGTRVGIAMTNDLHVDALGRCLAKATSMASVSPENPKFQGLPHPQQAPAIDCYSESTAACSPRRRAELVADICSLARSAGVSASGAIATSVVETVVASSIGTFAYHPTTRAEVNVTATCDDGAGYGAGLSTDIERLRITEISRQAVEVCVRSRYPRLVSPGEYTVILSPFAARDLVMMLAINGMGAMHLQEGRSFMTGNLGKKLLHQAVSIWDDGQDRSGFPRPFDAEGVRKQRVSLIENGTARGVVYDSYHAGKEQGKRSTGHALPSPNTLGPLPTNLFMRTGTETVDDMVRSTRRGILVTLLHYTRPVVPKQVIVTGITRNGTFLVENGEIAYPVKNLRFNQNYVEALGSVESVGSETALLSPHGPMVISVPAIKLTRFRFTGVTKF